MSKAAVLVAAGALVVVLAGAAAYAYFFSGLRTAPRPLAITPPATQSAVAPAASGLAGRWTVGSGSQAGYRVREQFAGQSSTHEAVARASSVSGGFTAAQMNGGYQLSDLRITVQLSGLRSIDQVAGFNVSQRDRIVQNSLGLGQNPDAVFQGRTLSVPATIDAGQALSIQVPGQLTIHGVTRDVVASSQAHTTSGGLETAGSIPIKMTDFGVSPPQVPITVVEPDVTIEFQLELTKSA